MSIALQGAARRDSQRVLPLTMKLKQDTDKLMNMLLRRKLVRRVPVSPIEPHWKVVRGSGTVNLEITEAGLVAIGMEDG